MKVCKNCIQPDTRPGIYFDENNVCGACLWEVEKESIDWEQRFQELQKIADWAKGHNQIYDCVVGISGGKDSTKQALTARDRLGLNCLLINNEPEGITDIGRHNIENLKNLGFDVISVRPNPGKIKKMIKRDFFKYLNPMKITEYALWSCTYIIAEKFDIPLIIQGENAGLTLGTSLTGLGVDDNALKVNEMNTLSSGWEEYLEIEGINEKDLFLFHYDRKKLEQMKIRGIWLQYFLKEWSFTGNAKFSRANGLKWRENFNPEDIGTYSAFSQLDTNFVQVNQMFKFIKLGFGQCMDHACYDLRENILSRPEAIKLVKKYDGQCSEDYIQKFCDYISISKDEFWSTVEKFRGSMWVSNSENKWHNTVWDHF